MVLKRIEIQGFKSFPDRIKVGFESGITAVVGPNGSGKSNISDAIRWVMGETSPKQLRGGSKMEAVIFDGTQNRGAMGFASVNLALDNTENRLDVEADEVIIGRKVYRSGNSEYTINGKQVRLKDIYELLLDTGLGRDGYSMIGQGRIAEIVSARSAERREIFEEASGIAKYRYRKNEAEKKLAATADNLVRLTDIFSELDARVGPLERDAEKAKRFIVLAEERKKCEITLYLDTMQKTKVQLREAANKNEIITRDYNENRDTIDRLESAVDDLRQKAGDALMEIEQKNLDIRSADEESAAYANRVAVLKNDNIHNTGRRDALISELSGINERTKGESERIDEHRDRLKDLQEELLVAEDEVGSLVAEIDKLATEAQAAGRERDSAEYRLASLGAVLSDLKIKEATAGADIETLTHQKDEAATNLATEEEKLQTARENHKQARRKKEDAEELIARFNNMSDGMRLKLDAGKKRTYDAKERYDELSNSVRKMTDRLHILEDLQKSNEGFSGSVRAVLAAGENGRLSGILGAVSSLLKVEKGYEVAIETALGAAAQNLIVESERSAKAAISMLKEDRLGRATFLPLDTVRRSGEIRERIPDGAIIAEELVKCDARYADIASSLLGRILVAEDLNTAGKYAKQLSYRYRIVTIDGQVINAGGSFTGGSLGRSSGAFSRRTEIETLTQNITKQGEKVKQLHATYTDTMRELAALEADMTAGDAERRSAQEELIRLTSAEEAARHLRDVALEAVETASARIDALQERIKKLDERKNEIARDIDGTIEQSAAMESQVNLHKDESRSDTIRQKQDALGEARLKALSLQKDVEQAQGAYDSLVMQAGAAQQDRQTRAEQIEALDKLIADNILEAQRLEEQKEEAANRAEQLQKEIVKIRENRLSGEGEITRLSNEVKQYYARREELGQERARLSEKEHALQSEYDSTITKLWEEYELGITDAAEFVIEYESLAALKRRVIELRSEIRSLGNVNVAAIEEYAEVSERYEFMKKQLGDIEQARNGLIKLISELSDEMKSIFADSFEQINRHFGDIFVRLFGGGSAKLTLSDPESILDSGIEISVSPPGKVIKNLESLSGGEQALVAIAIYFAILAVNPAPFCVLDEIDAALDDVNVVRFAAYLKNITERTQFIVITHRRGTMEEADVLYGVTMQEDGVSKLLRLDAATNDIHMLVAE